MVMSSKQMHSEVGGGSLLKGSFEDEHERS